MLSFFFIPEGHWMEANGTLAWWKLKNITMWQIRPLIQRKISSSFTMLMHSIKDLVSGRTGSSDISLAPRTWHGGDLCAHLKDTDRRSICFCFCCRKPSTKLRQAHCNPCICFCCHTISYSNRYCWNALMLRFLLAPNAASWFMKPWPWL